VNSATRGHIARLSSDGSLDTNFNPAEGANNTVLAVALQPDGKILISGDFTEFRGTVRHHIARVIAAGSDVGTLDTNFDPDADGQVACLCLQSSGQIVIGGSFTHVGGYARSHLARLNANGTLDTGFTADMDGPVTLIAQEQTGDLLVGGSFGTY